MKKFATRRCIFSQICPGCNGNSWKVGIDEKRVIIDCHECSYRQSIPVENYDKSPGIQSGAWDNLQYSRTADVVV